MPRQAPDQPPSTSSRHEGASRQTAPWRVSLKDNPFAPALQLLLDSGEAMAQKRGGNKQKLTHGSAQLANTAAATPPPRRAGTRPLSSASKSPSQPSSRRSDEDRREEEKVAQYARLFEQMEEKEERRKRRREQQEAREKSCPCKCGRAQRRRLPRPLATGGPRCNACVQPKRMPPPEMVDAPVFYPTEEEFEDPLEYIRSIQPRFFDFGICRIQPPASWQPPTSFHRRPPQSSAAASHSDASGSGVADSTDDSDGGPNGAEGRDAAGSTEDQKAPPPLLQTQASSQDDYELLSEENDFSTRLQRIGHRRTLEPQGRAAPFLCAFQANYAKLAIKQLREMDADLRDEVFPHRNGAPPAPEEVEEWFWERLASESEARILYCADLEGTAFPRTGKYGEHKWSLQKLAEHDRSLLRFVEYSIPGVNTPMLYFGILFSMFCWHVEDNYMYSVSYLHEGASKTWYGVSPKHAANFDRVAADVAFAHAVENDPQLLLKKAMMVPPSMLLAHDVPVCRAIQEPRQFVVTLPQAYHGGFSHGFNAAEAVNFMLPDWLPYAKASETLYRQLGREPVLDLEHILVLAVREKHSPEAMRALKQVVQEELSMRRTLRLKGTREAEMDARDKAFALGRGPPCLRCHHVCHLSFVQLGSDRSPKTARTRQVACLAHADELHKSAEVRVMFTRYSDTYLGKLIADDGIDREGNATLPPPADPSPPLPETLARVLLEHKRQKLRHRG